MVRYAFALRGPPKDAEHEIRMEERPINITAEEQLTEWYLCDINALGEVPVLAPVNQKHTIPDSVEITKYLADFYPRMIPSSHKDDINQLLRQLHSISFFALTFSKGSPHQEQAKVLMEGLLKEKISDRYRAALEHKLKWIEQTKFAAFKSDYQEQNEAKASVVLQKFDEILYESTTWWCYGLESPSALDAHLIVFIARLTDIDRTDLVPEALKGFAAKAMSLPEWNEVMQGRATKPPGA